MRIPLVAAAVLYSGCSMGERPTTAQGSTGSAAPSPAMPRDASVTATLPTCLPESAITSLTAQGDALIACFDTRETTPVTTCWSIADDNTVHAVAPAPPAAPLPRARPVKDPGGGAEPIELFAPDGWTIAPIRDDHDSIRHLEICDPSKACKRIPLAPSGHVDVDDSLASVAIDPSGTWVVIDRGTWLVSESRTELHAIATGKLVTTVAVPTESCTNIVDVIGDKLLLQGSDCANAGGAYAVFTWQGKRLTPAITTASGDVFSFGSSYAVLAPNRWVFADSYGLSLWDVQRGKRLASIEASREYGAELVVRGDVVVDVVSSGAITRYDDKLAVRSSGAIPACAPP